MNSRVSTDKEKITFYGRRPAVIATHNRANHNLDSDSNWLITLSDLLTLLLVFFIFALTIDRTAKIKSSQYTVTGASPVTAVRLDQRSERNDLTSKIMGLAAEDGITVRATGGELLIMIKEKVSFNPGEAEILESSGPVLDKIGTILKEHPDLLVEIDGHTDNVPISTRLYPSNWELSVARATQVLKYFAGRSGIEPTRFFVRGNADRKPLLPNDSPAQRAENRRVEIRLKEPLEPKNS